MISDYEILPHTADLKIRAYGKNLEQVFSNMLKGMFESSHPEIVSKQPVTREIRISARGPLRRSFSEASGSALGGKSQNLESLLVDFLSEALYLSDVNNEAYFGVEFKKLTEKELDGEIKGEKIKGSQLEIKAVTWHDLEIKKEDKLWQATVLFDI